MSEQGHGRLGAVLSFTALGLFWVSSFLVVLGANEEPFYGDPTVIDGLLYVGLGSVLVFCWVCWAVALVTSVATRKVGPIATIGLIVPVISIFYLYFAVVGYLHDQVAYSKIVSEVPSGNQVQLTGDVADGK